MKLLAEHGSGYRTQAWNAGRFPKEMSAKLSSPGGVYLAKKVNKNVYSEDFYNTSDRDIQEKKTEGN